MSKSKESWKQKQEIVVELYQEKTSQKKTNK